MVRTIIRTTKSSNRIRITAPHEERSIGPLERQLSIIRNFGPIQANFIEPH
jgi:hypothetical protein